MKQNTYIAIDKSGKNITTVIAPDFAAARKDIERTLQKPGRENVFAYWQAQGCLIECNESTARQRYLKGEISHQEYYEGIAEEMGLSFEDNPNRQDWFYALEDGDEHLNSIELKFWFTLATPLMYAPSWKKALRKRGDAPSLAGAVCTVKAQIRKEWKQLGGS